MQLDASFSPERVGRLRADFLDTDALLILDGKNIRYLTGFSGESGALMAGRDWLTLLVDGRFVTQARDEAAGAEVFEFRKRGEGIAEVARRHGVRSLGFESSLLSVAEYKSLEESLTEVSFLPLPGEFEFLRAVKNKAEIERIRAATNIAGEALAVIREMVKPGVREERIALELEYRMRRGGASQASFQSIIASGPNSALPHAIPGRREIGEGDPVTIDYGAVCDGYHSDETCTFFVGRASDRQQEVYRLVLAAHDRAIAAIREGVSCGEIDRIARSTLAEAGLDQWFSHGTGHGVGLAVHEAPRLAAGRKETLLAGMVVTVEPGVYFPGEWGIRIEDTVLVTKGGCEVLTRTSKDLTMI